MCLFLGGGGSDGNTTVMASCVYVCVVFNVKCTLFFWMKMAQIKYLQNETYNDNQHALTEILYKLCVNVVSIFPKC